MFLNKIYIKKFISLILCFGTICSFLLLGGCGVENFSIYFGISEMPKNIDPQKAQSQAELLAVRNCFRGLYKQDKDGNTVPDLAKSLDTSQDGLTYTFTLNDAKWSDETPVTAEDFVFGITRAADPVTASPSQQKLLNIKGVAERLNSQQHGEIGVKAIDRNTLEIQLVKPDETFLTLLTSAVFMPCNREFFENCKGKYGLDRQNILTNGCYYPSQWTEGRHLKLTLVAESSHGNAVAQHVFLSVSTTGKNTAQRIKAKEISMAVDLIDDFASIGNDSYTVDVKYRKNYVIIFNQNTELGQNTQLTDAFAKSVNRELCTINMNENFKLANSVIPIDATFSNKQFNEGNFAKYSIEFNPQKAREEFLNAVSQFSNKKLPTINVLTIDNPAVKSALNQVVSQWQSTLGAYVNISTVSSDKAVLDKVNSGNYTVALVPLSGDVGEILTNFSKEDSGFYLNNKEYDNAIKLLKNATSKAESEKQIKICLEILSSNSSVIPFVSVPTAYIYNSDLKNVAFSDVDGTVDFSYIYKNK